MKSTLSGGPLLAGNKPQTGRNLGIQKELGRQIDDTIQQTRLDYRPAYFTLSAGFGSQRPLANTKPAVP
jgi:hypothetical protein